MNFELKRTARSEERRKYKEKHRDKWLAEKKRYRERHKEEIKTKYKIYYEKNKERLRDKLKEWKKTPAGKLNKKIQKFKRRRKERDIIHKFTVKEWDDKVKKTRNLCPVCEKPYDNNKHQLTLDHIFPISKAPKGFIYTIEDVEPMCLSCNSKKGSIVLKKR